MKLTPLVHRIGNDIVAAYLVVTDDGITVIDAGLAGHWRDLERELSSLGRTMEDIRGIVLTHGDTDHIGFAERLRLQTGVPVYIHGADAARAQGTQRYKPAPGSAGSMRPGPAAKFLAYSLRKTGLAHHLPRRRRSGCGRRRAGFTRLAAHHRTSGALPRQRGGPRSRSQSTVCRRRAYHPQRALRQDRAAAVPLHGRPRAGPRGTGQAHRVDGRRVGPAWPRHALERSGQ